MWKSISSVSVITVFGMVFLAPASFAETFEQDANLESNNLNLDENDADFLLGSILDGVSSLTISALKLHYRDSNYKKASTVNITSALSEGEQTFLFNRRKKTNQAYEALGIKTNRKPTLGLCMSGGGYRAMLASLGFAQALSEMGIFDAATYNAGLSGSSWHLSKLMSMALQRIEQPNLVDFPSLVQDITTRAQQVVLPDYRSLSNMAHLLSPLVAKYAYDQIITPTDFYGILLGATLLDLGTSDYQKIRFSDFAKATTNGGVPMPIGTAVSKTNSHWFEFTPYQTGTPELDTYIEMYGLGRPFSKGQSTESAPEPSIHNLMGIMGSAFAIKGLDVVRHLGPKLSFLPSAMQSALFKLFGVANESGILSIDDDKMNKPEGVTFTDIISTKLVKDSSIINFWQRIYDKQPSGFMFFSKPELSTVGLGWEEQGALPGGVFANPFYGISSQKATSRLLSERDIELKDAGIEFNLPFPPLLRPERNLNVIIAYDASGSVHTSGARALLNASQYAKKRGLNFPNVTDEVFKQASSQNLTVIGDPDDPQQLTVIYIPLLRNQKLASPYGEYSPLDDKYTSTTNFAYPKEVSQKLIESVRRNVRSFENEIKSVLRRKAQAL